MIAVYYYHAVFFLAYSISITCLRKWEADQVEESSMLISVKKKKDL
jgi:hypothetical protein